MSSHQTVLQGDCREILPEIALPWDRVVLIVDPVWPDPMKSLVGSESPSELFADMWDALPTVPKRAAIHLGVLSDPRFLSAVPSGLAFFRLISLEYPRPSFVGRAVVQNEVAYLFGQPPLTSSCRMVPGRVHASNAAGRESGHPCPRKIEHLIGLIGAWTDPDDIVLDPFCGSGTTLLAAQYWGREAVGIEIVPEFAAMAEQRLAEHALELWGGCAQ